MSKKKKRGKHTAQLCQGTMQYTDTLTDRFGGKTTGYKCDTCGKVFPMFSGFRTLHHAAQK